MRSLPLELSGERRIGVIEGDIQGTHDAEVIAAANEHKMAMVFSGIRHFNH